MKIGIDARLWNETGVGRYIRNIVFELQEIDKKNEYVLFMRSRDIEKLKNLPFDFAQGKNFRVVPVDIRWHTIEEQLKFPQILNKENLDLMHFPYFSVPVRYHRPFVMTIHDLIINHFPTGKASKLPLYLYQLKRMGYNYVVKKAVERAGKIIVPLDAVKTDLIKTLEVPSEKIAVTHEGFDQKISSQMVPNDSRINSNGLENDSGDSGTLGKYFLYVGNAYPHKNLERLITAFSQVVPNDSRINSNGLENDSGDSEIKLLLVGKDDYFYKKLQEKIIKENFSGIIIKNNVKDSELAAYYKNAIALVAPSLMEGFGLPVLEALSSRCLVLASSIASFREVAQDAAIYFDQYSIGDMKEKMKYVSELDKLAKEELTKRGLKRAGYFSWRKMAEQTLSVYEEVAISA